MKKYGIAFLTLSLGTFAFAGTGLEDSTARLQAAGVVLHEIMAAPDKGIPEEVLNDAKCIAVVPNMAKGGFIVGGEHGRGVVTCRTGHGWSAPVFIRLAGGSFGFQIGGGETDIVFVVLNQRGRDKLLKDKFTFGGDLTAMAGPVGRSLEAKTDVLMQAEILSYSRTQGVFAGVNLSGGVLRDDKDDNVDLYDKGVSPHNVLMTNIPVPAEAKLFVEALKR